MRRDLLREYTQLQRELIEDDPATSSYQVKIQVFRQMGYLLITSGFEDDLDRLLRMRILFGGQTKRSSHAERATLPELHLLELRPAP